MKAEQELLRDREVGIKLQTVKYKGIIMMKSQ